MTRLGCRVEYLFRAERPRTGSEAAAGGNDALDRLIHLYALNRGILLTPFHNMALMSPGHDRGRRRPAHAGLRRSGKRAGVRRVPGTLGHMAQRLRASFSDRRIAVVASLAGLSLFVLGMLAVRMLYTGTSVHGWLAWNLFLAWIPFLLALLLYERARAGASWRVLVPLGLLWLAFFPNAPYLITDLKHIGHGAQVPVLYDVLLLSAAAWLGLLLGLTSLFLVHAVARRLVGALDAWALVVAVLALSSFGIYLGRVQRWNSWDLVVHPASDRRPDRQRPAASLSHPRPIGLTVLFTSFLLVSYLALYSFARLSAIERD